MRFVHFVTSGESLRAEEGQIETEPTHHLLTWVPGGLAGVFAISYLHVQGSEVH
jgi:hypothetical protein